MANRDGWWATTSRGGSRQGNKYGYGKPPRAPELWQPSIPSWEKKFCTSMCRISWKKLCETQRLMCLYPNVVEWDDSAGKEAFEIAKARYYAEINGLPFDIPLPDPNIYIDAVDYDAPIDPQLLEDLYRQPPASDDGETDQNIRWDSFLFADKPVPVSGWDDNDPPSINAIRVDPQSVIIQPTGWGDAEDVVPTNDTAADPQIWDTNIASGNAGNYVNMDMYGNYGNLWNHNYGWGEGVAQCNLWGTETYQSWDSGRESSWGHCQSGTNEQTRRYNKKRDGEDHFRSKSTNLRNQPGDNIMNNNWRNCRGRTWNSAYGAVNH